MEKGSALIRIGKRSLSILLWVAGLVAHLVAIYILYRSFLPIAKWYWEANPVRGVDLLNAATYQAYLARYFAPLITAWKYLFFNGQPLILDYPSLHFYLGLPFTQYFSPVRSVQAWMLVATFLYFVFSYLTFSRLSKSRSLSAVLAILAMYSVNVYGALIWGGSIPYAGTIFFLPLTIWLLVVYFQTGKKRWFAGAALALGLSQYGHAQVALSYGLAFSGLTLLLFPSLKNEGLSKRVLNALLFLGLVFLIGFPITGFRLRALLSLPQNISAGMAGDVPVSYQATPGPEVSEEVQEFYRTRIYQFYTDAHPWLFWAAGIGVLLFLVAYFTTVFFKVMRGKRGRSKSVFVLMWATSLLAYTALYLYLYSVGIDIFHGGWFRVFWPVPFLVGVMASVAFGGVVDFVFMKLKESVVKFIWLMLDSGFILVLLGIASFFYLPEFSELLYFKSVASGGFPGKVIFAKDAESQRRFSEEAVPEWLPVQSRDYRIYGADQTYNMWFNSFYDMPMARGYIDPTITDAQRWGIFLMDIVLDNNVAVEEFDYPVQMAKNAARFVLDWNAIRYLAGENAGMAASNPTQFSSYLTDPDLISKDERVEIQGVRFPEPQDIRGTVYFEDAKNWVRYLEVKEDLVGPILSFSDSPAVLFIGDESLWEIFIRTLAQMGLTSDDLIAVKGPKFLDKVTADDLSQFEAVVLYGYDYRNHGKAWLPIQRFVEGGGSLFVDTGAEVKESDSQSLPPPFPKQLPDVFPMMTTQRGDLGFEWDVEASASLSSVSFSEFSPLIYNSDPWNVSFTEPDEVSDEAGVLLSLSGKPVVISSGIGEGMVVWSGLNLPAHLEQNRNLEEAKLFQFILSQLLPRANDTGHQQSEVEFLSSERRRLSGVAGRNVLFKESNFPGWSAKIKAGGESQRLEIKRAGLGYPGVMWTRVPREFVGRQAEVEFVFRGSLGTWAKSLIAGLLTLVLFDKFAFNGKIFGRAMAKLFSVVHIKLGSWWEKEEEY